MRLRPLLEAVVAQYVTLAGMRLHIPGSLPIRLSVVMGNLRMQRMLDSLLQPGDTVVDVGANIGYNTLYAAHRVGRAGRVYALEPAQDNLAVLYANLFMNHLTNVFVLPYAAGNRHEVKPFFLRGDISAVNSLFHDNFYAAITDTTEVLIAPLDDLIPSAPDLVKIDVEGAELDVLEGMKRMIKSPSLRLIVEWHPTLQQAADHAPDALPRYLLAHGFTLHMVTHTRSAPLDAEDLPGLTRQLLEKRSPVEILAWR
ncbi:MAG: FkbM family methyltransferase [Caldilineaceae bacterium]|nr:FkbM family methyltransferase [Caldilineaceae bacterium]